MINKCFVALRWLAFVIVLTLIPQQAHACSCAMPGPPADALTQSSAVFAGKVINLQSPSSIGSSLDPVRVTFHLSTTWKGPASHILTVHTAVYGAVCGYGFDMGQEYLVYAYGEEGDLQVSLCSRTKPLANAAEDLSALGKGAILAGNTAYLPTLYKTPCKHSLGEVLEENSGFSTFLQTMEAAHLDTVLETAGPFTIFAPTNAAFANLPTGALEQLLANPTGQLTQILLFHIVPGQIELDDLEDGRQLTTLQGKTFTIDRSDSCHVIINGAKILTPNLHASNGIIHAIDTILLPPPD